MSAVWFSIPSPPQQSPLNTLCYSSLLHWDVYSNADCSSLKSILIYRRTFFHYHPYQDTVNLRIWKKYFPSNFWHSHHKAIELWWNLGCVCCIAGTQGVLVAIDGQFWISVRGESAVEEATQLYQPPVQSILSLRIICYFPLKHQPSVWIIQNVIYQKHDI